MEYTSTLFRQEHVLPWKFLGKWPPPSCPGGLYYMETRNIPSLRPSFPLASPCFPAAVILFLNPPFPLPLSLFLSLSLSLFLSLEKSILTYGRINHQPPFTKRTAKLSCNNNQKQFECEERRGNKRKRWENWGQNSPPPTALWAGPQCDPVNA